MINTNSPATNLFPQEKRIIDAAGLTENHVKGLKLKETFIESANKKISEIKKEITTNYDTSTIYKIQHLLGIGAAGRAWALSEDLATVVNDVIDRQQMLLDFTNNTTTEEYDPSLSTGIFSPEFLSTIQHSTKNLERNGFFGSYYKRTWGTPISERPKALWFYLTLISLPVCYTVHAPVVANAFSAVSSFCVSTFTEKFFS